VWEAIKGMKTPFGGLRSAEPTSRSGDGRRQREHHMIIRHRQQIGLARGQPFLRRSALALRAVPIAATIVRDLAVRALLTARDMAAEGRSAAVLNRRHHL